MFLRNQSRKGEPKGERKLMSSREEQRQSNISQESSRQREAVKPPGYAGAPSSSPAQIAFPSRKDQSDLLERMLETVMDRFLQQALLQVMNPIFDAGFSPHSRGFRPVKRAHNAVKQAQNYIQSGLRWTVDMDLESSLTG
jgi:hypothetical protein